jgi:hypothetical protein
MNARSERRLVGRMIDAYVDWQEACLRVGDRYRSWTQAAGPGDATLGYWRYLAALDHEEHAARAYSERVSQAAQLVGTDRKLAATPPARGAGSA